MTPTNNKITVPQKSLDVSEARAQLPRLLRQLRAALRIFWITQAGRPAAALVNPYWLQTLVNKTMRLDQTKRGKPFSIFGQGKAVKGWEKALKEFRKSVVEHAIERYDRVNRTRR